jgi:hypothetical protein
MFIRRSRFFRQPSNRAEGPHPDEQSLKNLPAARAQAGMGDWNQDSGPSLPEASPLASITGPGPPKSRLLHHCKIPTDTGLQQKFFIASSLAICRDQLSVFWQIAMSGRIAP